MVRPGDLLGFSSFLLEDPLGHLEAKEDFLLSVDGGPQGATNQELVEADGTGGSVPDVSSSRGVTEALPLELFACSDSVEGSDGDLSASRT